MKTKIKNIKHAQMMTIMLISIFTILLNNLGNMY